MALGDTDECADGAAATVTLDGAKVGEAVSNNYGEFVVDKLEPGKDYILTVGHDGYKPVTTPVRWIRGEHSSSLFLEKA